MKDESEICFILHSSSFIHPVRRLCITHQGSFLPTLPDRMAIVYGNHAAIRNRCGAFSCVRRLVKNGSLRNVEAHPAHQDELPDLWSVTREELPLAM